MNDMRQMTELGRKIENSSFDIIDNEIGEHSFSAEQWPVVRRVIHSTADFEFKHLTTFHQNAVQKGIEAIKNGCPIICDVEMIKSGLNKTRLEAFGNKVHVFISDDDVIETAKKNNSTRAIESVRKAHSLGLLDNAILACGNAPTFLLEVCKLYKTENVMPSLVIGVPVGFVSAVESKEEVLTTSIPSIVTRGRKGGSTIAVSIIHALMYMAV